MTCPNCGESHVDLIEMLDNGMAYCCGCDHAWLPQPPPRLIDYPERRRRDVDE